MVQPLLGHMSPRSHVPSVTCPNSSINHCVNVEGARIYHSERNGGWVPCVLSVQGCVHVSSFTGEHTHTHTHTHPYTCTCTTHTTHNSLSLESSPTCGVCPGLRSLMIDDIIKVLLSCFVPPDLSSDGGFVKMSRIIHVWEEQQI